MNLYEAVMHHLSEYNHEKELFQKEKEEMLELMDEKWAVRGGYKALEEKLNAIIIASNN